MPEFTPLTYSLFAGLLHERFTVAEQAGLTLELVEATLQRASVPGVEAFNLLFRGPLQPLLPQATYTFTAPGTGPLALFIVPVARMADAIQYQAVFN